MTSNKLADAYAHCVAMARDHYENFPVASRLLPARIRPAVTVIYAFARSADDIADEGDLSREQRLARLDAYRCRLQQLLADGTPDDPIFIALQDVIARHHLPLEPFQRLLQAFHQDVEKTRYADFGELMDYCRCSANPIGELLLHLNDAATERNIGYSNAICTALQLINFLQDTNQDYRENNRIYLPQDEMQRFGVTEQHIANRTTDFAMQGLMRHQIERARRLLESGAPLGLILGGRFGFELRLIIAGGGRILKHLHENSRDAFARPRLTPRDKLAMVAQAALPRVTGRKRPGKSGCGI
ncbi:MAG: squalene synthase HpnC [Thiohalophilus sp.]|uniref:squalene synthase HpnC n=1 Tax=Thiohalophilus sp. TaxID=3028392 RepID=UPI0028705F5E|nr:squalene synthase HpnC [Thiohalophilus sp.]MDR9437552.1 squalene synthase HpnC [Thiohalophilus sp.]